jgi:hypothetical protein
MFSSAYAEKIPNSQSGWVKDLNASLASGVASVACHDRRTIKRSHQAFNFGYSLKDMPILGSKFTTVPATTSVRVRLSLAK